MSQRLVSEAGQSSSPELGDGDRLTLLPTWVLNPPIILEAAKTARLPFRSRSRFRAGPVRKLRRRAVLKSGECNVLQSRISRRSLRFLQDIFTTLVDTQWRWTLLCFALSFLLSWLAFAGIWWLIAFTHGDFEPRHQTDAWRPCVNELHGFTSCFLFSIETQHTIGYGGRSTTEECPEAIFVMCIQSISGVMIQAFMVGIVFAKMSRPKQRTQTLLFSRQAVICQRDGELCIMFRVGDMRKSHIIGAHIRAQLIKSRTTKEGEVLHHNQQELAVGADGQPESLFFIWPCTVVHRINAQSPFYCMSAEDMLAERFELVVILEGTIESTGQTTQARSSYLPQEILWGHRFEPMVSYSKERQGYEVDYSLFDSTVQVDTPLCSGRELSEFYRLQDELRQPAFSEYPCIGSGRSTGCFAGAQLTTPQEEFTTSFWRRYPQLSPTVPSARYGCYCPECKEECHWRTLDVSRCVLCHEFKEKLCSCPLDDYRRYLFPAMGFATRNNSPLEQHPNRNPWMLSSCYNSSSEDETAMSPARSANV
ncbi:PREDICTED: G protein-activated inward rectifier potassium channel 3-like [Ceratosolen solmsi marchali]|uniref:G protein-activated inward rectifier potassium channel 3-like n=1 Tax=Ceratosolen solmsi marchali TaxID=326594 RepID=A0AAJ7E0F8_9HYME|nr:PREDICTED: G protein-activated inward rectifier potassium channel 3-like [Ceratosolen solmsi marchali]